MNTIKVIRDSDSESPRDWDNIGTIAYKQGRYSLGEEQIADPIDWLTEKIGYTEEGVQRIANKMNVNYYSDAIKIYLEAIFENKFIAHKVYLYDHSGQSISVNPFGCRWDSGQLGYIYCSKEKALKEYCVKIVTAKLRLEVLRYMEGEIKTYNQYLNGDVYGFKIEDENGEELNSCYGFYGTDFKTNGMLDHIDNSQLDNKTDEEIVVMLEEAEIEY
jgi:DNA-binding Lrp family transcriptional regulator